MRSKKELKVYLERQPHRHAVIRLRQAYHKLWNQLVTAEPSEQGRTETKAGPKVEVKS